MLLKNFDGKCGDSVQQVSGAASTSNQKCLEHTHQRMKIGKLQLNKLGMSHCRVSTTHSPTQTVWDTQAAAFEFTLWEPVALERKDTAGFRAQLLSSRGCFMYKSHPSLPVSLGVLPPVNARRQQDVSGVSRNVCVKRSAPCLNCDQNHGYLRTEFPISTNARRCPHSLH